MSKATQVSQKRLPKSQEPPATSVTAFQGITRRATQRSETASDSTNQLVTLARRWRNRRTARQTSALPTSVPSTRAPSRHPVRARSARGPPPAAAAFPIRAAPPAAAAPPAGQRRPCCPGGRAGPAPPGPPRRGGAGPAGSRRRPRPGGRPPAGASLPAAACLSFPRGGGRRGGPARGYSAGRLGATHRAGCSGPPASRLAAAPSEEGTVPPRRQRGAGGPSAAAEPLGGGPASSRWGRPAPFWPQRRDGRAATLGGRGAPRGGGRQLPGRLEGAEGRAPGQTELAGGRGTAWKVLGIERPSSRHGGRLPPRPSMALRRVLFRSWAATCLSVGDEDLALSKSLLLSETTAAFQAA